MSAVPLVNAFQLYTRCSIAKDPSKLPISSVSGRIGENYALREGNPTCAAPIEDPGSLLCFQLSSRIPAAILSQIKSEGMGSDINIAPLTISDVHLAAQTCSHKNCTAHPRNSDTRTDYPDQMSFWTMQQSSNENYFTHCQSVIRRRLLQAVEKRRMHQDAVSAAQLLYHYYLTQGTPDKDISPLLLPTSGILNLEDGEFSGCCKVRYFPTIFSLNKVFIHIALLFSREEVSNVFREAMQKAVLEYALLCPSTRKRLQLDILNPFFSLWEAERNLERSPLFIAIPEDWKLDYTRNKRLLSKRLRRCDPIVMSLRDLWTSNFSKRPLLKTGEELDQLMPLGISDFRQIQAKKPIKSPFYSLLTDPSL